MCDIIYVDSCGSSNDCLRGLDPEPGAALLAGSQSAGRGRQGRSFASPPGGLYLSVLLAPEDPDPALVTAGAALCTAEVLESLCGVSPGIKWVNDLLLDERKLCGILCEAAPGGVIVGLGLNVNTAPGAFPPELRGRAVSLLEHTGRSWNISDLAEALAEALRRLPSRPRREILEGYRRRCVTPGRQVRVSLGPKSFAAFAESVEEDFSLLVRREDGSRETLGFGEVSIRRETDYL